MPRFAAIRRAPRTSASVAAVAALTAGLLAPASGAWAAGGPGAVPGGDGWAGKNLVQTGDAAPTGSARAAAADRLAAATGHPRGIDVSRYQSSSTLSSCSGPVQVGWAAVRASGRSFAFIKATGTRSGGIAQDPCFDRNWAGARAAGLYRGAYHFAIPSRAAGSAAADARFFVQVTGTM